MRASGDDEHDEKRSTAAAATWSDEAVRAARIARLGVKMGGVKYPSVP